MVVDSKIHSIKGKELVLACGSISADRQISLGGMIALSDRSLAFNVSDRKRLVLVVDDELINREILKSILQDTYELLFAATGQEALDLIHAHFNTLSLILLDLILPDFNGMEILHQLKENASLASIPVIVMTSDRESEVESLTVGAGDVYKIGEKLVEEKK